MNLDALESQFTQELLNLYEETAKLKPSYKPVAFQRMVHQHGGKETADRLLGAPAASAGFSELYLRGPECLKLSLEYIVLMNPWRELFTPEQLDVARTRLEEVGCERPLEDSETKP